MDINKAFHQFDLRGEYPTVMDERLAFLTAANATQFLGKKALCVAGDQSNLTPRVKRAVVDGVVSVGGEITDLGNLPTPLFYYAIAKGYFLGGFEVTASHLAQTQTGLKIVGQKAIPLNEKQIIELKQFVIIDDEGYSPSVFESSDHDFHQKITYEYLSELARIFETLKFNGLVIFDAGQTLFAPIIKSVLDKLSLNAKILTLPRGLNPMEPESRINLKTEILNSKAKLGIIWDGDGDRCLFLDRHGGLIPQTFIAALIAKKFSKVAFDVRLGSAAYVTDKIILPAWAQNMKFAMQDDPKIEFACEDSGHAIYRDWYCLDDGLFAALKFLQLMEKRDWEMELEILKMSFYEAEEENFPIKTDFALVLDKIADYYRSKDFFVNIVDGVTVVGPDFKFNLRPSLTEPLLRLNLEAKTKKQGEVLRTELVGLL